MKKIVITLFIIIFISKAEAVELVSSWTDIQPNIDGYILDDEWSEASLYKDTFFYHNVHENRDEKHPFILRLSNDEKHLYIGIKVFETDKPQRNKIIFLEAYFQNNDYLDVRGFERFKYYEGKLFREGKFQENLQIKGIGKMLINDFRFYEIKVPISAGQVLKFAIYYCEIFNPIGVLSGGEWEKSGGDIFPHEAEIKRFQNFAILKTSKENLEFKNANIDIANRNTKIDQFEPDDDMENAREIEIGKLYHHSLSQDDTDWSFFVGKPGYFYVVSTSNLSEDTDTMLQVWKNGKLIDGDDDSGFSLWASKVEFISKTESFYFIKVEGFNGKAGFYSLSVNSFNLFREIPLPAPLRKEENTVPKAVPPKTVLLQNYPNPFNPETWIPYRLAESRKVEIKIYNVRGELIRALNIGERKAGDYITKDKAAYWDGRNEQGERVASGIYFYTLGSDQRKLAIIK